MQYISDVWNHFPSELSKYMQLRLPYILLFYISRDLTLIDMHFIFKGVSLIIYIIVEYFRYPLTIAI